MASSARIFFAGVGTTFLILGVGFGGGLFMANSALKESSGNQAKSRVEQAVPARVILPTTAQAAEAPKPLASVQQVAAAVEPVASASPEPVKPEKKVEKIDLKKAEMETRERRKRYAERKARREAARARQQLELLAREQTPVMAFGSDEPRRGFGLFDN